jgi:hypothetical protein
MDLTKPPTLQDVEALKALGWNAAATQLRDALLQSYKPTVASDPAYVKWHRIQQWCAFFDEAKIAPEGTADIPSALLNEFMADETLGSMLLDNLKPEDKRPEVLRILAEIRSQQAEGWKTHKALAVAIAVVFDQKMPRGWPHGQVDQKIVPLESPETTDAERFAFWLESESTGKLAMDPKRLDVEQLKFVVDTWVSRDELKWAQKNVHAPSSTFGMTFSSIKYDTPRYDANKFDWQGTSYALADIKKDGGICIDQAYFASTSGKARGIPTLLFTGEGNRGGHAWLGYMKSYDKWDLDAGRYAYDNYATGHAQDPQTRKKLTDHDLLYLAARFRSRPEYAVGLLHQQIADLFKESGSLPGERSAVENAIRACPDDADSWDRRTACLVAMNVPDTEIRAHYEAALRQFSRNADLKTEYTRKYIDVLRKANNSTEADRLERTLVTQNTKDRSDLSMEAAKAKLNALLKDKQWEDAYKQYFWVVGRLGQTTSTPLYHDIVVPFVNSLRKEGQYELALRAVHAAQRDLRATLDTDFPEKLKELEKAVRDDIKAAKQQPKSAS